jgi:hypothetical protein
MSATLAEQLGQALAAVEEAGIPDDLRPVAFASAFWASWGPAVQSVPAPPPPTSGSGSAETVATSPSPSSRPSGGGYEQIAQKLDVSVDDAEFAFELTEKELRFRVRPSKLDSVRSKAQRQVIYLMTAARQAAGIDTETTAHFLKSVCKDLGKDDTNFGFLLGDLHGKGVVVSGSNRSRTIKANAEGFEIAGNILKELRNPST